MSATPKAICGYIAGWLLVICFVGLFSVIFSFVGTIICAAVAGMMMGAGHLPRRQAFALSVVFPMVISSVFRVTKAELPLGHALFIALLCFAVFWIIYFASWALTSHESSQQRARPSAELPPPVAGRSPLTASGRGLGAGTLPAAVSGTPSTPCSALTLEVLQGDWLANNSNSDLPRGERRIGIRDGTILLTISDPDGHVRYQAKAQLRFCGDCALAFSTGTGATCAEAVPEVNI